VTDRAAQFHSFQRVPIGPEVLGGRRTVIAVARFAEDRCARPGCGDRWADHYQPRLGGRAGCWATHKGVLCNCGNFMGSTRNEAAFVEETSAIRPE
jgi:hypothetical protein